MPSLSQEINNLNRRLKELIRKINERNMRLANQRVKSAIRQGRVSVRRH